MRTLSVFSLAILFGVTGCAPAAAPAFEEGADSASTVAPPPTALLESDSGGPAPTPISPAVEACEATSPRAAPVTVHVLPEAGETPYRLALEGATKSIRVFGYMMGYGVVYDTLRAKARGGLDVRVILDGDQQRDVNEKYRIGLEADGAKVTWGDPGFSYMHAKAVVIDDRHALVSTGNYSRSYMLKERNFLAAIDDSKDVHDIAALFDADWSRTSPSLACTRLLVSPFNARERILSLLDGAQTEIVIESMQLADSEVRAAVERRAAAGVSIRVVLATASWIGANANAGSWLTAKGIAARWLKTPSVHVKAIVVDGVRAYLGSENLSSTSLDRNREIGVIVSDAAAVSTMKATIEADYAIATPF